ncbi:MAG: HAMP domain-containing protein [Candidatus Omnitrophota bacterium]
MSYSLIRNLSLVFIVAIILCVSLVSFLSMGQIAETATEVIRYQRPKLDLMEKIHKDFINARDSFFAITRKEETDNKKAITLINQVIKETSDLKELVDESKKDEVALFITAVKRFKTVIFSYTAESEIDPTGASVLFMEQNAHEIAREAEEFFQKMNEEISTDIRVKDVDMLITAKKYQKIIWFMLGIGIFCGFLAAFFINYALSMPVKQLINAARKISKGDVGVKIMTKSKNEFGELFNTFNDMSEDLAANEDEMKASNQQLIASEQMLRESDAELRKKIRELESFNKIVVGRELKMIELKKEINELLRELGKEPKYET